MNETSLLTEATDEKIEEVRSLLEEAGEDVEDYPVSRIVRMIQAGFLDD
jgi:hypothetical protein